MTLHIRRLLLFIVICALYNAAFSHSPSFLSLSGEWRVRLGSQNDNSVADKSITLPGTLDQAGYGDVTEGTDYGILSRKHKFIGQAWYSREIEIPKSWSNGSVELYLERVMWRSQVWIDGQAVGTQDGLGTPHFHNLGKLKPGRHQLTVCVNNDMIYNIGDKGHSYGEYTQIIWNGMVGNIELRYVPAVSLSKLKVWPDVTKKVARLAFDITQSTSNKSVTLKYTIHDLGSRRVIKTQLEKVAINDTLTHHTAQIAMDDSIKLWNEFTPDLYEVTVEIASGKTSHNVSSIFGFREVTTSQSKILVNGKPTFMRGNLDCVHFPLTGYPSCDIVDWDRIFGIYKAHGLNHVRFHSWCPPEAAFAAADRMGIYIQAEVLWIDWWMSVVNSDRPEMTTKGLPKGLGKNASADTFVKAELARMVEAYGNHPSFTMLCIGNELGNSDFEIMQKWIDTLHRQDNRRLYATSTARRIMPCDQYMVTHNIPGVGATYGFNGTGTDYDLEYNYAKATIPIIAHELGQYPVYPLWREIKKYTGVLEARNLQQLKQLADKNRLANMDSAFHKASGALQTLLYKSLIENLFRTSSCGGFSFLSMTDYSGQGEALVGWLDSFWDSKGIVEPATFKQYSNSVVLLARFPKYIYHSGERFVASTHIANYGINDITDPLRWQITDSKGDIIANGLLNNVAHQGKLNDVGNIELTLPKSCKSARYTLELSAGGYRNSWPLWIFSDLTVDEGEVLVSERFDEQAQAHLSQGGKVLLLAHNLGHEEETTPLNFTPLFWSNSFFPGQSNKTLGLHINHEHPALSTFPTSYHTDWQWQSLCNGRSFNLNSHPNIEPIVQPISDFHISDRLGSIFECRVGVGKLLVCGHNLTGTTTEAKTLKNSLLTYMNSSQFAPKDEFESGELQQMFYNVPTVTTALPQGFEKSVLYIMCGAQMSNDGSQPWNVKFDNIVKQHKGCSYTVKCDDTWRDSHGTAWTGHTITVEIATPNGILGDLYVKLENWNGQDRKGIVAMEGRESTIDKISTEGQWIKLFVMREDTNDGKVTFRARSTTDSNLMISEIAFVKTE